MKKDSGLVYGFGAYILWGILPLYWKLLGGVSSIDCITKDAYFYSRGQSTFKKSKKGSRCYYGGDFRLIKLGNLYLYGVNWTSSTS